MKWYRDVYLLNPTSTMATTWMNATLLQVQHAPGSGTSCCVQNESLCKHAVVFECLLFWQVAVDGDINQTVVLSYQRSSIFDNVWPGFWQSRDVSTAHFSQVVTTLLTSRTMHVAAILHLRGHWCRGGTDGRHVWERETQGCCMSGTEGPNLVFWQFN